MASCPDSCDVPYRKYRCGKPYLTVEAPPCLLQNKIQKSLYKQLYAGILDYYLENQVYLLESTPSTDPQLETYYNAFVALVCRVYGITLGDSSAKRVLVAEPDGTVILDTAQSAEVNTVTNWLNGTIGPNHNTRVAIMNAQQRKGGVGYEKKYSSSTAQFRTYVAIRLGQHLNNAGTIRISVPVPPPVIGPLGSDRRLGSNH